MVETPIADVVGPSIAADDPDAPAHEMIDDRQQGLGGGIAAQRLQKLDEVGNAQPLRPDFGLMNLRRR